MGSADSSVRSRVYLVYTYVHRLRLFDYPVCALTALIFSKQAESLASSHIRTYRYVHSLYSTGSMLMYGLISIFSHWILDSFWSGGAGRSVLEQGTSRPFNISLSYGVV